MEKARFRRRQYIVKRGMQYRYIGLIFLFVVIVVGVTGGTLFYTAWTMFGEKLASVYPQGRLTYIFRHINFILIRNLIIFVFPVIFVLAVYFSHKIAGPTVRIENTVRQLAKCNFDIIIKLRKGDEFTDVADAINELALNLKSRRLGLQEVSKDLAERIAYIDELLNKELVDKKVIEDTLNKIKEDVNRLNQQFAYIQGPPADKNTKTS